MDTFYGELEPEQVDVIEFDDIPDEFDDEDDISDSSFGSGVSIAIAADNPSPDSVGHVEDREKSLNMTEAEFDEYLYSNGLTDTAVAIVSFLLEQNTDLAVNGCRPNFSCCTTPSRKLDIMDDVWEVIASLEDNDLPLTYKGSHLMGIITPTAVKSMHLSQRMLANISVRQGVCQVEDVSGMGWNVVDNFYSVNRGVVVHLGILFFLTGTIGIGVGNNQMWVSRADFYGTFSVVEKNNKKEGIKPVNAIIAPIEALRDQFLPPAEKTEGIETVKLSSVRDSYVDGRHPDLMVTIGGLEYLVERQVYVRLIRTEDGYYDREFLKRYPVIEPRGIVSGTVECEIVDTRIYAVKNVSAKPSKIKVIEARLKLPAVGGMARKMLQCFNIAGTKQLALVPTVKSAAQIMSILEQNLDVRTVYHLSSIYHTRFNQNKMVDVRKELLSYASPMTRQVMRQLYRYKEFISFDYCNFDRTLKYSLEGLADLITAQGYCVDMRVLRYRIMHEMTVYGDSCYFNDKEKWIPPVGLDTYVDSLFSDDQYGFIDYNVLLDHFKYTKHNQLKGSPRDLIRYLLRSGKYIFVKGGFQMYPRGMSIWVRQIMYIDKETGNKLFNQYRQYMVRSPFSYSTLSALIIKYYPAFKIKPIGMPGYKLAT